MAPGQFARHYSPRTPVMLHRKMPVARRATDEAWLFLTRPAPVGPGGPARPFAPRAGKNIFWLDAHGNLRGAARRLFAVLRELDGRGFRMIHAEMARGRGRTMGRGLLFNRHGSFK